MDRLRAGLSIWMIWVKASLLGCGLQSGVTDEAD
jgi:hypothetical protein